MAADLQQYLQQVDELISTVETRAVSDPFKSNPSIVTVTPEKASGPDPAALSQMVHSSVAAAWTATTPLEILRSSANLLHLHTMRRELSKQQHRSVTSMARQLLSRCHSSAISAGLAPPARNSQSMPRIVVCGGAVACLQACLESGSARHLEGGGLSAALRNIVHRSSVAVRTAACTPPTHTGSSDCSPHAPAQPPQLRHLLSALALVAEVQAAAAHVASAETADRAVTALAGMACGGTNAHVDKGAVMTALQGAPHSPAGVPPLDQAFLQHADEAIAAALTSATTACPAAGVDTVAPDMQRIRSAVEFVNSRGVGGSDAPPPLSRTERALGDCQASLMESATAHALTLCDEAVHAAALVAGVQYRLAWRAAAAGITSVFPSGGHGSPADLSAAISGGHVSVHGLAIALSTAVCDEGALKLPVKPAAMAACPPSKVFLPPLDPACVDSQAGRSVVSTACKVLQTSGATGVQHTCEQVLTQLAAACSTYVQDRAAAASTAASALGLAPDKAEHVASDILEHVCAAACSPAEHPAAPDAPNVEEAAAVIAGRALFSLKLVSSVAKGQLRADSSLVSAVAVAGASVGALVANCVFAPSMNNWPWRGEGGASTEQVLASHATWVRLTTADDESDGGEGASDAGGVDSSSHLPMPLTPSHALWDCVALLHAEMGSVTEHGTRVGASAHSAHAAAAGVAAGLQAFALYVCDALQLRTDALGGRHGEAEGGYEPWHDALRLQSMMDMLCLMAVVSGACPGDSPPSATPLYPLVETPLDGGSSVLPLVCSAPDNFILATGAFSPPAKGVRGGVSWTAFLRNASASLLEAGAGSSWSAELHAMVDLPCTSDDAPAWSVLHGAFGVLVDSVDPVDWALCEDAVLACAAAHVEHSCVALALTPPLAVCTGGAGGGSGAMASRPWERRAAARRRLTPQLHPLQGGSGGVSLPPTTAASLYMPGVMDGMGGVPNFDAGGQLRWQDELPSTAAHEAVCSFFAAHSRQQQVEHTHACELVAPTTTFVGGGVVWSADQWLSNLSEAGATSEARLHERPVQEISSGLQLSWRSSHVEQGLRTAPPPGAPHDGERSSGLGEGGSPAAKGGVRLAQRTWGALAGLVESSLAAAGGSEGGGRGAGGGLHTIHDLDIF